MKKITLLGSTGSIGTQALDVIEKNVEEFSVYALACGKRVNDLEKQVKKFKPKFISVAKEDDAIELQKKFPNIEVSFGKKGLVEASKGDCDIVLNALMGIKGLEPTLAAIYAGKDIALANKETLVTGGQLVMEAAKQNSVNILPVDSEHSAIFQALQGNEDNEINRIILTASGGPFRTFSKKDLELVTLEQALNHPKWSMGAKITIDSATMMNKGLEVIEAKWLFNVDFDQIDIAIHPQSIVHSLVEYKDSSIIAQLGMPDMRVPISYALTYPKRQDNNLKKLNLFEDGASLTFEKPNRDVFKCIDLAYEAGKKGGSYTVVLNGANEVLVDLFLKEQIKFSDIPNTLEEILSSHCGKSNLTLEEILYEDNEIRKKTIEMFRGRI